MKQGEDQSGGEGHTEAPLYFFVVVFNRVGGGN